jgi:hypothetical protein
MRTRAGRVWAIAIAACIGAGVAAPALDAHHSFAMYDQSIERTFTGKLVRFIIGANHSQFIFDLVDEGGTPTGEQWGVETGPASQLARQGITVESFPIGTIFTVSLNPLRDGRNFGALQSSVVMCGMTMPPGGCTEGTGTAFGR